MAINEAQLMQAIYDLLFAPITTSPPGAPGETGLERSFITVQKPGRSIDPEDYRNLWSPGSKTSNELATKRFSDLVDPAPALTETYQPNGQLISHLYRQVLNAQVISQKPTTAEKHAYEEAEKLLFKEVTVTDEETHKRVTKQVDSPIYRNYKQAKANYAKALATYHARYLEYMQTPAGRQKWPLVGSTFRTPVEVAWNQFRSPDAGRVEDALASLEQVAGQQIARVFKDANQQFLGYQRSDPTAPGQTFAASYAIPSDWWDPSQDWAKVSYTSGTSETKVETDRTQVEVDPIVSNTDVEPNNAVRLWSIRQGNSETQVAIDHTTENLSIQFEYLMVKIERSWLRYDLFDMPDWSIKNLAPGAYSTGTKVEQEESLFPLLPQSFILIRNLQITADWGRQDLEQIDLATHNTADVGFGPFLLSQTSHPDTASRSFRSQFESGTLRTPSMQIVGWINTITPFSPPELNF